MLGTGEELFISPIEVGLPSSPAIALPCRLPLNADGSLMTYTMALRA